MQLVKVHQPVDSISIVLLVIWRCHRTELVEANIAMTDPVVYIDVGMYCLSLIISTKCEVKNIRFTLKFCI